MDKELKQSDTKTSHMKKQHRDKLKAVKKCNGKCPSKMTKGEKTKCQMLEKELGKAGKGCVSKTKCGQKLEKFNIKEPKAPKDEPECEQPHNKFSKEHAEKCQAKKLEEQVKKEEAAAKKAEEKEKEEKKEDKKEDEKKKEPESQASVEAKMIQILKSTKEHMEGVSKSLREQAETARLLAKVRDHTEVKKTEDEIKKLKTEITKKPKEAQLDVNVDGVHIGHMVLQSGGNYDLNLKSDEIKSTVAQAPPKKLIDDGKKIIDADKSPAAAEKSEEKKSDDETLEAVKKTISDSLRSFAQTYASTNTMMLAQTDSELFEADDEKTEKPNFRKYPHLIKTANQDADGDDDDDDDDDEDGEDGDGDGDGDSDGDGDGDDDDDDDDDEEPENPNADLMRAKLSDAQAAAKKTLMEAVAAKLRESIDQVNAEDAPPKESQKSSKSSELRKKQLHSAVVTAVQEKQAATPLPAPQNKVQVDTEIETELTGSDPSNRLKPDPGSQTKKPEPPPQRKVPPKVSPEHTEVSQKSDKCRKERPAVEDCSGHYLTQADNENELLDDEEVAKLPEDFQKKLNKAKALADLTAQMAPASTEDSTVSVKQMKSSIALSKQEREHLRRTRGQPVGTDKDKDGTKPTQKTTEGVALDKQRGLKVKMVENKLSNTAELPVSATKPAVNLGDKKEALQQAEEAQQKADEEADMNNKMNSLLALKKLELEQDGLDEGISAPVIVSEGNDDESYASAKNNLQLTIEKEAEKAMKLVAHDEATKEDTPSSGEAPVITTSLVNAKSKNDGVAPKVTTSFEKASNAGAESSTQTPEVTVEYVKKASS